VDLAQLSTTLVTFCLLFSKHHCQCSSGYWSLPRKPS